MATEAHDMGRSTPKLALLALGSALVLALCLAIGPLDCFSHGFSSEHPALGEIDEQDLGETVELSSESTLLCTFSPSKPHFAGFEIYLANRSSLEGGTLDLDVFDETGSAVGSASVDLALENLTSWCHPEIGSDLAEGERYALHASAVDCPVPPAVQMVDADYLDEAILDDSVLLGLAYRDPTFKLADKLFLIVAIVTLWAVVCLKVLLKGNASRPISACMAVLLGALMCWNYSTSILDDANGTFEGFQQDSESLVSSVIESAVIGEVPKTSAYGLGRIVDESGRRKSWQRASLPSEDEWADGFSSKEPKIKISDNAYTRSAVVEGGAIRFEQGSEYRITSVDSAGAWMVVTLDAPGPLSHAKLGDIEDAELINPEGDVAPSGRWEVYKSQYGLQGKLFKRFALLFDDYEEAIASSHLLCASLLSLTLMLIVVLLKRKYSILLAGCFYVTFLLSPWIVNFADNLYWVEFTWFLPVLIGLLCSSRMGRLWIRILCYGGTFLAVMAKCLCGYEYVSAIMLVLVAFPIADLAQALLKRDRSATMLALRAVLGLGAAALLGFFVAIALHAGYRGDGDIVAGMIDILQKDVLRRTSGGSLDAFEEKYWPSLTASKWEVLLKYFCFKTELITGIPGNLFPLLTIAPLAVFYFDVRRKALNAQIATLYVMFLLVAISWYALATSHSYIHTHMNYVLWYFGFIQMCLYVLVDKARRFALK